MVKCNVRNRAPLVVIAHETGLVPPGLGQFLGVTLSAPPRGDRREREDA